MRVFSLKLETTKDLYTSLHRCYTLHSSFFCRMQFPILPSSIVYLCFHIVLCPKQLFTADLLLLPIHSSLYRQVMKLEVLSRRSSTEKLGLKGFSASPSLEMLKPQLDVVLSNLLHMTLPLSRGIGADNIQKTILNSSFL